MTMLQEQVDNRLPPLPGCKWFALADDEAGLTATAQLFLMVVACVFTCTRESQRPKMLWIDAPAGTRSAD